MRALGLAAVLAISATVSGCAWAAHHDAHTATTTKPAHCAPGTGDERVNDSPCIDCDALRTDPHFGPNDQTYLTLCTPPKTPQQLRQEVDDYIVSHYNGEGRAFLLDLHNHGTRSPEKRRGPCLARTATPQRGSRAGASPSPAK